jgi:AcrR family transcriptional regulator
MADILDSARPETIRVPEDAARTTEASKNPRKRPRQERSQALVDSILTAASRVLSTVGIERSTTTRIAERAGVSIGSLYQYFRDRDELLGTLVERRLEENLRRFEGELEADAEPAALIEHMVRAGLATYLEDRPFYATILSYAPLATRRPLVVFARRRAQRVLARKLREHARELAPMDHDVAAFVLLNAFMGVALMAVQDEPVGREHRDSLERELVRMFTTYLLPPASQPRHVIREE